MPAANEKTISGRFDLITTRGAFWLGLVLLAMASIGTRFVLRYLYDRRFDEPKKFEQVVWLKSPWGWQQDQLRIWLSHLGEPEPGDKKVGTQLLGIGNANRTLALTELEKKYLRLVPANISSDNLYIILTPAKALNSLTTGFEALAKARHASIQAGSFWKPTVYSFAIRARLENSRKVFRRTYHFRSWARGEIMLLWIGLGIGIYLATTLTVRSVTILAGHPQRPWDLLRGWFSHLGKVLHIWWLRYIVSRRIAKSSKWAAAGLAMLAAIASFHGTQTLLITTFLTLLASLAAVIDLVIASHPGRLDSLRKKIAEIQTAFQNKKEFDKNEILQQRAHLIRELENLKRNGADLDSGALPEIEQASRAPYARMREIIDQMRRELKSAYQQETARRVALKVSIAAKIDEARRDIAERVLAYLNSEEFRGKLPLFDAMVSTEEFNRVQDPELVFQGERERGQTEYKLISLRPFINSEAGEPLLVLTASKDGPNFRIQQFVDEDHPIKAITLPLEQRPSQIVDVRFEVHFGALMMRRDEALPAAEKIPVSLENPDPNYASWYADLPPLKKLLAK